VAGWVVDFELEVKWEEWVVVDLLEERLVGVLEEEG
jgi:hypothetical protein